MDPEIRNRILDLNPWIEHSETFATESKLRMPETFIPRNLDSSEFDNPERAKLIIGPRQAGKSTYIWSLLQNKKANELLFLNGEEYLVQKWCDSSIGMLRDIQHLFPQVRTVFIDEAQHIENAALLIKGLIDSRSVLNLLVTGSSSFHLIDRTRESLAGRAERRVLLPFSIDEIVHHPPASSPAIIDRRRQQIVERQMLQGGYPGVWFHENPRRELGNLVEAYILRDASDLFRIRRPEAFRKMLQLAAGQVGQMINHSEWASQLSISSNTVREYLNILQETWILYQLPAFAGGKRREISSASRIHFFDMGLRNALIGAFDDNIRQRPDRGALAEGLTFCELFKAKPPGWSIQYWRAKGGAEVDFVLSFAQRKIGFEVKAGQANKLSRSARSFIDAYSPEAFVLVTSDHIASMKLEKTGQTALYRASIGHLHELMQKLFNE